MDILEVLIDAYAADAMVDGWTIARRARRPGPVVYNVIDQLEDADWVSTQWEPVDDRNRDRRRLYRLKPSAIASARALVREMAPVRHATPRPGLAHGRTATA